MVFFYSLLTTHFDLTNSNKIKKALTIVFIIQLLFIVSQIILGDIPLLMLFNSKEVYEGLVADRLLEFENLINESKELPKKVKLYEGMSVADRFKALM